MFLVNIKVDKVVELVDIWSVINRAYPIHFFYSPRFVSQIKK